MNTDSLLQFQKTYGKTYHEKHWRVYECVRRLGEVAEIQTILESQAVDNGSEGTCEPCSSCASLGVPCIDLDPLTPTGYGIYSDQASGAH